MKIKIPRDCKQKDLPNILKTPVLLNLEKYCKRERISKNLIECNIGQFEWVTSIETEKFNFPYKLWSELNQGKEVDIPENVVNYWKSLMEEPIKIEFQSDKIYYATSNNKRFKITIEEIKDIEI